MFAGDITAEAIPAMVTFGVGVALFFMSDIGRLSAMLYKLTLGLGLPLAVFAFVAEYNTIVVVAILAVCLSTPWAPFLQTEAEADAERRIPFWKRLVYWTAFCGGLVGLYIVLVLTI